MATTASDSSALSARLSTASTAARATAAPAKPWEQRSLASRTSSDVSGLGASTASIGAAAAARSSAPLTASAADTSGTYSTAANQLSNTMGMNTTGSMMGNTAGYGGMSSYSSPGYGMGTTGYGATGYGASGYGGYGGMSSYGGYGGGYGSTFGGGYGMSRYGGGYGGGMMGGGYGMGGGMDPNGQMGMLHSFSQTVGSIGQLTEMLGMNAEALNFCIGSFVNFVERIGAMCAGMASMVTPRPQFPPGHPMHGPPPTEEEERSRKRRVRVFQFFFSMVALTSVYKFLRWLGAFKGKARRAIAAPPTPAVNRNLERIFQNPAMGHGRALLQ